MLERQRENEPTPPRWPQEPGLHSPELGPRASPGECPALGGMTLSVAVQLSGREGSPGRVVSGLDKKALVGGGAHRLAGKERIPGPGVKIP